MIPLTRTAHREGEISTDIEGDFRMMVDTGAVHLLETAEITIAASNRVISGRAMPMTCLSDRNRKWHLTCITDIRWENARVAAINAGMRLSDPNQAIPDWQKV